MTLTKYLTANKFGLWIDLRSMADTTMHGNGQRLVNTQDGVQLEIERTASGSGNTNCHIFNISDSQMNIMGRQLESVHILGTHKYTTCHMAKEYKSNFYPNPRRSHYVTAQLCRSQKLSKTCLKYMTSTAQLCRAPNDVTSRHSCAGHCPSSKYKTTCQSARKHTHLYKEAWTQENCHSMH